MPVETNQNTDDPNNGGTKTFGVEIGAGDNQITDRNLRRKIQIRTGFVPVGFLK